MNRMAKAFPRCSEFTIILSAIVAILFVVVVAHRTDSISANGSIIKPILARWSSETRVSVKNSDRPWLNLSDGREIISGFDGDTSLPVDFEHDQTYALSLASADFDEDGTPDLVAGYGIDSLGMISFMRGNVDAVYPNNPDAKARRAKGEFTDTPFLGPSHLSRIPIKPDLLVSGDFNADGHIDIAAAARDRKSLCWFQGDGRGRFVAGGWIELPGNVTAMAAEDINRRDGLQDLIVAVKRDNGGQVLIFEHPYGAAKAEPETFTFDAPVTSVATGLIEGDSSIDVVVATRNEIWILEGRDRGQIPGITAITASEPRSTRLRMGFEVESLAIGQFLKNKNSEADIAVLSTDRKVHLLERSPAGSAGEADSQKWLEVDSVALPAVASMDNENPLMLAARVSARPVDSLVLGRGDRRLEILTSDAEPAGVAKKPTGKGDQHLRVFASLEADSALTAVLTMRLNSDALADLVILRSGSALASIVLTAPAAIFTVNSASNAPDCDLSDDSCLIGPRIGGVCTGPCTLRAAITQANNLGGASDIRFNIPTIGVPTITADLVSYVLSVPMTIDGTTQPGGMVELTGPPGFGFSRFVVNGDNSVVRGFTMNGNGGGYFIDLRSSNNRVEGNRLGTNVDGTAALGGSAGVAITEIGSSSNFIGYTTPFARNIISSGNISNLAAVNLTSTSSYNQVIGNYIGTNAAGDASLGNRMAGVLVSQNNATIGGSSAGAGNVISGVIDGSSSAYDSGIVIGGSGGGILIQGNKIGTNADGTAALANARHGITNISGSLGQFIGGTTPTARNLISGNLLNGIDLQINNAVPLNRVTGNYLGTTADGYSAISNGGWGILVGGRFGWVEGNIISGNASGGVQINQNSLDPDIVANNWIGTNADIFPNLGNGGHGLFLNNSDGLSIIGNTISANSGHGLLLTNSRRNRIQGNIIGISPPYYAGTGNLGDGIRIDGSSSDNNFIGGDTPGEENVFAYNGGSGVAILPSTLNTENSLRRNTFNMNGRLGIDLTNDGITINDNCDLDTGVNRLQNYPIFTSVVPFGRNVAVSGRLNSAPNVNYTLDFYVNTASDPSGNGEGRQYVGSTRVSTPAGCVGTFELTLSNRLGNFACVSATATDWYGNTSEFSPCTPVRRNKAIFDFDGDGRTDVSVWRPSEGNWYINKSSGGIQYTQWGAPTDLITPGDFDGDGKTEIAVFRPSNGNWYILNSDGATFTQHNWGIAGDIPVVGDYTGNDGKADVAVWRPSNGFWYILRSTFGYTIESFGQSGDVPVVGDFDGDDRYDLTIFRPSNGTWWLLRSTAGFMAIQWGIQFDRTVAADYDGDGKYDIAVWRPSEGNWYILRSSDFLPTIAQWGLSTDIPVPGDYDGDGRADISVYRGGTWHLLGSRDNNYISYSWGLPNDTAIPSVYLR